MSNKIIIDDPRFLPTKKVKKKISKKLFREMNSNYYEDNTFALNTQEEENESK